MLSRSYWFVGWEEQKQTEEFTDCSRGVFELGQVGVPWDGWFGLVVMERISESPLPFYENISTVPAEI
jgi:hypothetical protein